MSGSCAGLITLRYWFDSSLYHNKIIKILHVGEMKDFLRIIVTGNIRSISGT